VRIGATRMAWGVHILYPTRRSIRKEVRRRDCGSVSFRAAYLALENANRPRKRGKRSQAELCFSPFVGFILNGYRFSGQQ